MVKNNKVLFETIKILKELDKKCNKLNTTLNCTKISILNRY